jgi:TPR repeat protein
MRRCGACKPANANFSWRILAAIAQNSKKECVMSKMEELLRQQAQIAAAIETEAVRARDEAAKGAAQAQYDMAVLMHFARGVPQNYVEAMKLYQLAAAQGLTEAQLNLGLMFENGQGTPEDFVQALRWYKQLKFDTSEHFFCNRRSPA